nr:sciellin [Loxodonta africana]
MLLWEAGKGGLDSSHGFCSAAGPHWVLLLAGRPLRSLCLWALLSLCCWLLVHYPGLWGSHALQDTRAPSAQGGGDENSEKDRSQDLDNLIKVNPLANKSSEQGLDELINVSPKAVRNITGNQDLDKLIEVNPETLRNNQRNHDLDKLIKVNPAVIRSNQSQDLEKFIEVKPSALRNAKRDQDLDNLIEVNSNVSESNVSESKNGSSSVGSRHEGPKDTVVYTRTYVENSKSPKGVHPENTSGNYIQTVYSTSDRSVIERDMCTYCRKPLGVEAKMILDELQIRCHCTCFKCEICKQPLENLKAGDSIWIYRQTIHCKPCYSKVMAKWIQ